MFFCLNFTLVYCIEEKFQINLSLSVTLLAWSNHGITLKRRLSIESILHIVGSAILKGVLISNLSHTCIKQELLLRESRL